MRTLSLTAAFAALSLSAPAAADIVATPPVFVEFRFDGVVEYQIPDKVTLANPDGSEVLIDRSEFGAVRLREGDAASVTLSYAANDPAFVNAACGGQYRLDFAQRGGPCSVATRVQTPFSQASFGGAGGDDAPFIRGINLRVDPVTGDPELVFPGGGTQGGTYSFGYLAVPDYQYSSATQTISGPGFICVDAFNCRDDIANGSASVISFPLKATGDLGLVRPGFNVGYLAGNIGSVNLSGSFRRVPTEVPAPGMWLLFGLGAAIVPLRRHRVRRMEKGSAE